MGGNYTGLSEQHLNHSLKDENLKKKKKSNPQINQLWEYIDWGVKITLAEMTSSLERPGPVTHQTLSIFSVPSSILGECCCKFWQKQFSFTCAWCWKFLQQVNEVLPQWFVIKASVINKPYPPQTCFHLYYYIFPKENL